MGGFYRDERRRREEKKERSEKLSEITPGDEVGKKWALFSLDPVPTHGAAPTVVDGVTCTASLSRGRKENTIDYTTYGSEL